MRVRPVLRLRGRLERGPGGLVLHTACGGIWELETRRSARRLIGQDVNVIGRSVDFSGLVCEEIWPADQPRPRPTGIGLDYLFGRFLVAFSVIAFVAGLLARLR